MRKYEVMIAVRGSLVESEANEVYSEFVSMLKKEKAEIVFEESWGKKELAYRIKQEDEAYYYVLNFMYDPELITELNKSLEINKNVIRYIVLKIEKKDYEPMTKEFVNARVEEYYAGRQERQKKSMPKTRATTAVQLEEDLGEIKKKKDEPKPKKNTEEKIDEMLMKDLSI